MAGSYKKASIQVAAPRAKPSGASKFAQVASNPKNAPLKTRIYTKSVLREDPTQFGGDGFGNTGLNETPSILGMGKNAK